jgi:hypothetical protein
MATEFDVLPNPRVGMGSRRFNSDPFPWGGAVRPGSHNIPCSLFVRRLVFPPPLPTPLLFCSISCFDVHTGLSICYNLMTSPSPVSGTPRSTASQVPRSPSQRVTPSRVAVRPKYGPEGRFPTRWHYFIISKNRLIESDLRCSFLVALIIIFRGQARAEGQIWLKKG